MIKIIAVGTIKETYLKEAIKDYSIRLQNYTTLKIISVSESRLVNKANESLINKSQNEEGISLLKHVKTDDFIIALDAQGKSFSSIEFSDYLNNLFIRGKANISILIGGSHGLSNIIKQKADLLMSMSQFTFPHQLARLIILEQLYRAFKILKNETYHK